LKTIAGIAIGLSLAFGIISVFTLVNIIIWPLPEKVDPMASDPVSRQAIAEHVTALPLSSKLITSIGHIIAAFSAGFVAVWMSESAWLPGIIVAAALTSLAAITAVALPGFFWLLAALLTPASMIGAYFGLRMVK